MSHEHESRDGSNASIRQGTPKMASNHQKPRERHGTDSPCSLGNQDLDVGLLVSRTVRQYILLFKLPRLWYLLTAA